MGERRPLVVVRGWNTSKNLHGFVEGMGFRFERAKPSTRARTVPAKHEPQRQGIEERLAERFLFEVHAQFEFESTAPFFGRHIAGAGIVSSVIVRALEREKPVTVIVSTGPRGQRAELAIASFVLARGLGRALVQDAYVETNGTGRSIFLSISPDATEEFLFLLAEFVEVEVRLQRAPPPAECAANGGNTHAIDVIGDEAFDAASENGGDGFDAQDGGWG